MWGYGAKSCGQLLGYLIEDLRCLMPQWWTDAAENGNAQAPKIRLHVIFQYISAGILFHRFCKCKLGPIPAFSVFFLRSEWRSDRNESLDILQLARPIFPMLEARPTPSSKETALPMALHDFMIFYVRFTDGRNHWYKPGAFSPISRIFQLMLLILFWLNRFLFYV